MLSSPYLSPKKLLDNIIELIGNQCHSDVKSDLIDWILFVTFMSQREYFTFLFTEQQLHSWCKKQTTGQT